MRHSLLSSIVADGKNWMFSATSLIACRDREAEGVLWEGGGEAGRCGAEGP